jgi:hypothetical protein
VAIDTKERNNFKAIVTFQVKSKHESDQLLIKQNEIGVYIAFCTLQKRVLQ